MLEPGAAPPAAGIVHSLMGSNGSPLAKLADFERAVDALGGEVDVAMVKLCYADFAPDTDVDALFTAYEASLARVRAKHPGVKVVPVTAPLTVVQTGLKAWAKRQLGRAAYGEQENVRRHAFNEKLRAAHAGEALFDLAAVESTRPDGTVETYQVGGASVPRLRADLTDDGGHLNAAGRRLAAEALVRLLAEP